MIEIIEYRDVFKSQVKELIDDNFGEGYSNVKRLYGPEIKSFVAILGDELIGYSSAIINQNDAVLDLIVVDKEHRGIGLGERLFKKRLHAIKGIRTIRINHWIREKYPKPFCAEDYGFSLKKKIDSYWSKSSLEYNYKCLECLSLPCKCSCAVYYKIVI